MMLSLSRSFLLALPVHLLVIGCSTGAPDTPSAPGEPEGTMATRSSIPPTAAEPVWKASSTRIELSSFGFWSGSFGYAKDRAELTAEQLAALEGLETTSPIDTVMADTVSYELRVYDADGTVARYRAVMGNARDSDEGADAADLPTIDMATLEPFLATMHCLSAKRAAPIPRRDLTPLDPSVVDIDTSEAPALPTDTGCVNGLYVPYACSDSVLRLNVDTPTTYELVGESCLELISARVYTEDGTLLAQSLPSVDDGTCFRLRHDFAEGRYVVVVSKTNHAGCNADGAAGDIALRLRRVP